MTLAEAALLLQSRGLQVSYGPDSLAAAFERQEPHPALEAQGVSAIFAFGFSIQYVRGLWFLRRGKPPERSVEFRKLAEAVDYGLKLYEAYLAAGET